MSPRPTVALAAIDTPHGQVLVRRHYAAKQHTWLLIFDGAQPALRLLLPGWRPRSATSTRTQLTPPVSIATEDAIATFWQVMAPKVMAGLANPDQFTETGTSPPVPTYRTLGQLADVVQGEMVSTVRPTSAKTYAAQWSAILRRLPSTTLLREVTRERLQALVRDLIEEELSPVSVRNLFVTISRALDRAVEDQLLQRNPVNKVRLPKAVGRAKVPLTTEQRDRLLAVAQGCCRDIHLVMALGSLAGLRRGEILALRWSDVDLRHRVLHVRCSDDFATKSGRDRTVPICAELHAVLVRYRRAMGFVVRPENAKAGPGRWAWRKTFARVAREAGVPHVTPHILRHTFASLAAQAGVGPWKLRGWLGHRSVADTEGYVHGTAQGYDSAIERSAPAAITPAKVPRRQQWGVA